MRCLALAQAWQDSGGQCVFAMAESTPAVGQRLRDEGMEIASLTAGVASAEDRKQTACIAGQQNVDWIVVDGYRFGWAYQRAIKTAGFKLLFLDDNVHAENYCADLVLNQNMYAISSLYAQREPSTRLLLGPRYVLLRREFRPWGNRRRDISRIGRKLLVTMGGSDPNNLTAKTIEAVLQLSDPRLEVVVLAGGSNLHLQQLRDLLQKESMRLIIDAADVPAHMLWADVALAGAGTTFWELCFLGLPSVLLVLTENQEGVAEAAAKMGISLNLGRGSEVSPSTIANKLAELLNSSETRSSQSIEGRKLVDGRGTDRVMAFLSDLQLRRTVNADCGLFWQWANEPGATAASFRNKTISWEHHEKWFRGKLADPNAILYTATNRDGVPIGEVRYQMEGSRAVLSIGLGVNFRGCRCGQKILTIAIEEFFHESEVEFIDAYVKPSNEASLKLFAGAGFAQLPPTVIEGQAAVHFALRRRVFA